MSLLQFVQFSGDEIKESESMGDEFPTVAPNNQSKSTSKFTTVGFKLF